MDDRSTWPKIFFRVLPMSPFHSRRQRGFFLLDVAVGFVLVLTAMLILTQIAFQLADHRTLMRQRQIGIETLQNVGALNYL